MHTVTQTTHMCLHIFGSNEKGIICRFNHEWKIVLQLFCNDDVQFYISTPILTSVCLRAHLADLIHPGVSGTTGNGLILSLSFILLTVIHPGWQTTVREWQRDGPSIFSCLPVDVDQCGKFDTSSCEFCHITDCLTPQEPSGEMRWLYLWGVHVGW